MQALLRLEARCGQLLLAGLLALPGAAVAQATLPFEPLPSAFQSWLNNQRDWPKGQRLQFSRIGQCLDQTARQSPYRMPVYTCLAGEVRISGGTQPSQVCQLQRVSYFPNVKRTRYWTAQCRPAT